MQQDTTITAVAHTIQLAVAPVFLLSGVRAMLAVLTSRVARVVDRARTLEARLPRSAPAVAAALSFLREIFIATANLRIGPH